MAELPFSKQDFLDLKIDEILREVDVTDHLGYSKVLRAAITNCHDSRQQELLRFLEMLTSTSLRIDYPDNPYGIADNMGVQLLTFFSEIVHEFSDPEIKSKIGDVLWLRNRDYKMAELAIDSYLSAARSSRTSIIGRGRNVVLSERCNWPSVLERRMKSTRPSSLPSLTYWIAATLRIRCSFLRT